MDLNYPTQKLFVCTLATRSGVKIIQFPYKIVPEMFIWVSFLIVNLSFYLILKCLKLSALKHLKLKKIVQYRSKLDYGCIVYGYSPPSYTSA